MAQTFGQSSGTMDLAELEYFDWDPEGSPVSIRLNRDAMAGMARDVAEGLKSLPRRGLEVGGLLLGRIAPGEKPTVWIERYQRVSCEHRFGPQFILDDDDKAGLERAAANILSGGDLAVVGLYRSHTRDGFQLEKPDLDLVHQYFSDASDLILLIKPEGFSDIFARFYVHDSDGGARQAGDSFPFQGRLIVNTSPEEEQEEEKEETREQAKAETPVSQDRPRRLVPDFAPLPVAPPNTAELPAGGFLFPPRERVLEEEEVRPTLGSRVKTWIPLVALLLVAGAVVWLFSRPATHESVPSTAVAPAEPARPLGLSVEPMGQEPNLQTLRVSWNPNATALHDARSVQLFVREADDQNRIELSPPELTSASYTYSPKGNDVTFRLEVVESSGRISAESFRFERSAPAVVTSAPKTITPTITPRPPSNAIHRTEPKAIHRAPPVIAAGIRPRIKDTVTIDVRVHIDEHGRVTQAVPAVKPQKGLDAYLAGAAVQAARQWRFEPARENGKAVPGTQTIHFVFQK
jgi:TonB family protein